MKRLNKNAMIGGLLAFSMMIAGTGYAYWTDTLNVNAKAQTGDLAVVFADLGLYAQYSDEGKKCEWTIVDGVGKLGYQTSDIFTRGSSDYNKIAKDGSIENYYKEAKKYNNIEFNAELENAKPIQRKVGPYTTANTNGSDRINIKIDNIYPGYAQVFRSDILNVGTLAAKLSELKFTVTGAEKATVAEDMLGIALYVHQEQNKPEKVNNAPVFKLAKSLNLPADAFFTVGKVDFVRLSALKNVKPEEFRKALQNNTIFASPGSDNRFDLFVGVAMDPDKDGKYTTGSTEKLNKANDDTASQNKSVEVSIDFLWDQFNVGKDAGKGNILVNQNRK